jgi:hypothetical protein
MGQARHIFLKDVRYLRYQILLVVLLAFGLAWTGRALGPRAVGGPGPIDILLLAAASFMIARLIHAEAIPGDRQFWLTRPYQWKSLLAAKLGFIVAFVHLPVLLAHLFIVVLNGFPLLRNLAGLVWTQLLIAAFVSLPVAALAAMTGGLVPFVVAGITVIAVVSGAYYSLPFAQATLGPVDWVRSSILFLAFLAIAIPALYVQYKRRRTIFSRAFALSGLAIAAIVYLSIPWPLAFAVQARLSKAQFDTKNLTIVLDPLIRPTRGPGGNRLVEIVLPITVRGVPSDLDFRADGVSVWLQSAGGRSWKRDFYEPAGDSRTESEERTVILRNASPISSQEHEVLRQGPVTARVTLFLTAFGKPRAQTIALQQQPVNVMDGLQCFEAGRQGDVLCRSAFRWPSSIIDARVTGSTASSFTQFISYSPFPANLTLNPVETRWASAYTATKPLEVREVTISLKEPIAHVRRDLELTNVPVRDSTGKK